MAKTKLTPEEEAAQAAANLEKQAEAAKNAAAMTEKVTEKVKGVFNEYPTVDEIYCDEKDELFFSRTKADMKVYKRTDLFTETT